MRAKGHLESRENPGRWWNGLTSPGGIILRCGEEDGWKPRQLLDYQWLSCGSVFQGGGRKKKESVLLCQGCCNKVPQSKWLKPQEFISPPFWRLNVQDTRCQQGWFLPWALSRLCSLPLPLLLIVCWQPLVFSGL